MGRRKGSKNKSKQEDEVQFLKVLIAKFKELGVTPEDLKKTYGKGKTKRFLESDLIRLFEDQKGDLQQIKTRERYGRKAGTVRALRENEIIEMFAQKIAEKVGKAAPVDMLLQTLKNEVKEKELKF